MPNASRSILASSAVRRLLAILGITALSAAIALIAPALPLSREVVRLADHVFYDAFYRLRPLEDQTKGPVLIVAVDDQSLRDVDAAYKFGWPWPREFWGHMVEYLQTAGARAVGFDLVFTETSVYQNSTGDDDTFSSILSAAKIPLVFGSRVRDDGSWERFVPAVPHPIFGAVNVGDETTFRDYKTTVATQPSFALATVKAAGDQPHGETVAPRLLHYYGPYKTASGGHTFTYISASHVLAAALASASGTSPAVIAKKTGLTPEMFRGKIVLIGAITVGTYDLKSSPLSPEYPGVEVQATAIDNLLDGQAVLPLGSGWQFGLPPLAALIATLGVILPRRAILKALGPLIAIAGLLGAGVWLFIHPSIHFLAPAVPLLAVAIATVAAFAFTYFLEDRQRRFMLRALSKVVSPEVARQLALQPDRLTLGTIRTNLTLLFTDLANFTDMSEAMDVQKLGELLNRYLGEMSDQVLQQQGTLDKYIGDAIMCFWNAPLPQENHAVLACRAALSIAAREEEIRAELQVLGAAKVFTRIGVNTTDAAVGFVGSSHLFNYTALGDGVNLASRLEGANKLYGSRILLSQTTADRVKDLFFLRKVDVLRVMGKRQPMAVYELLSERKTASANLPALIGGYEKAFGFYQLQNWDLAERELLELVSQFADDGPSLALLKRIADLRLHPPGSDWDGVYEAKGK